MVIRVARPCFGVVPGSTSSDHYLVCASKSSIEVGHGNPFSSGQHCSPLYTTAQGLEDSHIWRLWVSGLLNYKSTSLQTIQSFSQLRSTSRVKHHAISLEPLLGKTTRNTPTSLVNPFGT